MFDIKHQIILLSMIVTYSNSKQYYYEMETAQLCPNNAQQESPFENLKFQKFNRTHHSLNAKINFKRPLDENTGMAILLDRWSNGNWISMPFLPFQASPCRYLMRYVKAMWMEFAGAFGVQHPEQCPVPAGQYQLDNYIIDLREFKMPSFWPGRFRFTALIKTVDQKVDILCGMFMVKTQEIL